MTAEKLYDIFRTNFPCVTRGDEEVRKILSDSDLTVLEEEGGVLLLKKNSVVMLAVDAMYRNRGIGSRLLDRAEGIVKSHGYDEIVVGIGSGSYLAPGVPTSAAVIPETFDCVRVRGDVTRGAAEFFLRRGYYHAEDDSNIFDMRLRWADYPNREIHRSDGVTFRFAETRDIEGIKICVDDAEQKFTKYYISPALYRNGKRRVLVAQCEGEIVGALLVEEETEEKGIGSIGCTAVKNAWQGRGIATDMVYIGTGALKDRGMRGACLNYTYSSIAKMYARSGYKISLYYLMARKKL